MNNKLKLFNEKFLEKSLNYKLKADRYLYSKLFPKFKFRHTDNLKEFLMNDHLMRETFIFKYAQPLFGGLHPKNIFNYRNEFFKENVTSDDVVIDVGCGTGQILYKISPIIKKGIGVDYDPYNKKMMEENFKAHNLEFIQGDMYTYDYNDLKEKENYNVAIYSHLIEHVEDPVSLLKKVNADKVLICVPSQEKWFPQLKKHLGLPFITDPTHFREYSRKQLISELVSAGYSPVYIGFNPEGEIFAKAIKVGSKDSNQNIRVSYAQVEKHEFEGGRWKITELDKHFPEKYTDYNLLYLLSAVIPKDPEQWVNLCKSNNRKIILNQNGVHYPAWFEGDYDLANSPNKYILNNSDFIIYQSKFSKLSADKYLDSPKCDYEIIYNAVDTEHFIPNSNKEQTDKVKILATGLFYEKYRYVSAIKAFAELKKKRTGVKLLIGGKFLWSEEANEESRSIVDEYSLAQDVEFLGDYTKESSVNIYNKADILLHTKYNDPCPVAVIEAMSCGLPIVYTKSGGVPELVDDTCGVGMDIGLSWEENLEPTSFEWADALIKVMDNLEQYSRNARQRAVENFDIKTWIEKHRTIFNRLLEIN